jgi:hypothetical protein
MQITFGKRRAAPRSPSPPAYPPDFDAPTIALCEAVRPYTMTGPERVDALRQAVEHVVSHGIDGDIVECGVWMGGSMMAVIHTLRKLNATRRLHLFDTFAGMPSPGPEDLDLQGTSAGILKAQAEKDSGRPWCDSSEQDVRDRIRSTGYPAELVTFVVGRVEDTIPVRAPERIAILRLDTDWYESTRHELEHLYPRLAPGGILIIDDYGHWQGARKAVDEYLGTHGIPMFLSRIDYTARLGVKPAA